MLESKPNQTFGRAMLKINDEVKVMHEMSPKSSEPEMQENGGRGSQREEGDESEEKEVDEMIKRKR